MIKAVEVKTTFVPKYETLAIKDFQMLIQTYPATMEYFPPPKEIW